ncbi:hypothetical protein L798_06392 [Zootermopsis nevadensis]|uniref:LRRCT domain-containing protein n=2 Tax=Zootermopsis nevadensis TaxID=136037 RepID=A0A067R6T9_ZOONE|nr:hypothetical protein L798_06392 [Zootermopsis nevadensis]
MSHNPRLSKIDVDAFKDVGICSLDLSYNVLSSLDEKLTHWESLDAADLQGNPWDCTCPLQWVLDRLVPHLYRTRQDLLYELRCDVPIQFRNKRLVHFYKWKKAAFCSQTEQLRAVPESDNVEVTFGLSDAMIYVTAGLTTLVAIMVVAGIVLQRRFDSRRRARNRRM